jgi:predicted PhzF superfamily epimerase YddE/YHI9
MMDVMQRGFRQVDVFGSASYRGNPLAVVVDADGLTTDAMQQFANWTNLSETTFLTAPTHPDADYAVRIFTTTWELPFAGHPTLGSCQVWLDEGGAPMSSDHVVQECGAGLVEIRRDESRLAFAAPPLVRSGPVEPSLRERIGACWGSTSSVRHGSTTVPVGWALACRPPTTCSRWSPTSTARSTSSSA